MKNYIEQKCGNCDYCYRPHCTVRKLQLRANVETGWQECVWVCDNCRFYLRGRFKYAVPKDFGKFKSMKKQLKKELQETGKISPGLQKKLDEYWAHQRKERMKK